MYREVFILRDVQGMNIRETADVLGLNEPLVRTRLLSLDPANRAWMMGKTYRDALEPGQVMSGFTIGEVVELAKKEGGKMNTKETAFRFLDDGPVPGFYWVDEGFGCALSGQLPRAALLELAQAVYKQLES